MAKPNMVGRDMQSFSWQAFASHVAVDGEVDSFSGREVDICKEECVCHILGLRECFLGKVTFKM